MKLNEIITPKVVKPEEELPSLLRPQAGHVLSRREKRQLAHKIRLGQKPAFLKKQAESVE